MQVYLRVYGDLRRYVTDDEWTYERRLEEGSTVDELLRMIGIPDGEPRLIWVNKQLSEENSVLKDGDEIVIGLPVGGGGIDSGLGR